VQNNRNNIGYGRVYALCTSKNKGTKKYPQPSGFLKKDFGLDGDSHAGSGRQISLLMFESIKKVEKWGINPEPGLFAENITTTGIDLTSVGPGTILAIGDEALIEVTQIGKECHIGCEIFKKIGRCIMPGEGVFARVIRDGSVRAGDIIKILGSR